MPYTVKAVPSPHDPADIKHHVVRSEEVVSVHEHADAAQAHVDALNAGKKAPKAKKKVARNRVARKHK